MSLGLILILGSLGMRRLDTVVSSLVLRRTKEDINKTLKLTRRSIESHTISLQDEEKQVYSILFTEARKVRNSLFYIPQPKSPPPPIITDSKKILGSTPS
jgi:SNF2 family DNA or RNA helicase